MFGNPRAFRFKIDMFTFPCVAVSNVGEALQYVSNTRIRAMCGKRRSNGLMVTQTIKNGSREVSRDASSSAWILDP